MGKVLTDADFGIDGGKPAATVDNDEPVIDAGDLEPKPPIAAGLRILSNSANLFIIEAIRIYANSGK